MRADMAKVIVERPRLKAWTHRPKGLKKRVARMIDRDGGTPVREGIMRNYGYNTKSLNEHLGPLRRYLDSQVGRPWNAVFAEICERIDRSNPVQDHVRDHVAEYVETNAVVIDGIVCHGGGTRSGGAYGTPIQHPYGRQNRYWYVCPKTGLLKKLPPYREPLATAVGPGYPFPNRVRR